jgi:2-dehydropantoate 2-reductase
MKIAVLGAGSVGSYYGAVLKNKGFDVTLICRGDHYNQISSKGLSVKSNWGNYNLNIKATDNVNDLDSFDIIFYTPKLYSNKDSLPILKEISNENTLVITIQNGVNSHNEIAKFINIKNIIPAATFIEAEIESPGVILQQGSSAIIEMGEFDNSNSNRLQKIHEDFNSKFLQFKISKNILTTLWEKMIIVGAFGTIMTSFRMSFRELIDSNYGKKILRETMKEILSVGVAEGIKLSSVSIDQIIINLEKEADEMTSSMFNDLKNNKPLEIDSILGHVVELSLKHKLELQYSTTLVSSLEKFKNG